MSFDNFTEPRFSVVQGLEVAERYEENSTVFIIKNPISNKFFKLGEAQYKLLMAFDGNRTTSEIVDYMNSNDLNLSFDQVEKFKNNLINLKVISSDSENLLAEKKRIETEKGKTFFQRILFIKLSLLNPDVFVEKVLNKIHFIFSPLFIVLMTFYILFGIGTYVLRFSPWEANLITNSASKNINIVIMLYLITISASFLHEMAHALTCKNYGGKVHEIGVLFIYFRPGLFCNISDSYLFKERKHRIYVSLAGIILDFAVWSTIIITGYLLNLRGLNVYFIPAFGLYGLITILLEFNPLIKLDGYYTLTELVNIYNLRENSFKYLKNIILKHISRSKISKKEKQVYLTYSIFSAIYCTWLISYTFYIVIKYLILKLSSLGIIIAIIILLLLFYDFIKKIFISISNMLTANHKNIGG